MMLVYWVCRHNASDCYSIRARTKREAEAQRLAHYMPTDFEKPERVTVIYPDGFSLVQQCLSEYRIFEGYADYKDKVINDIRPN